MGLPGPAEPPPDQTRHDIPTQSRAGFAEHTTPAHLPPAHAAGTPGDGVSMRFGPGVAAPDGATAMWRAGRSPAAKRRRRRRLGSLFSTLLTLAILGGVIAWLFLQNRTGDLAVNDVRLKVEKLKKTCGDVSVTGTITTNGEPGVLTYQWRQSDKKQPEDQQEQNIGKGQKSIALPFLWKINGKAQNEFTATLTVFAPDQQSKTASIPFTYVCRG
jgi:hypothetical protein